MIFPVDSTKPTFEQLIPECRGITCKIPSQRKHDDFCLYFFFFFSFSINNILQDTFNTLMTYPGLEPPTSQLGHTNHQTTCLVYSYLPADFLNKSSWLDSLHTIYALTQGAPKIGKNNVIFWVYISLFLIKLSQWKLIWCLKTAHLINTICDDWLLFFRPVPMALWL